MDQTNKPDKPMEKRIHSVKSWLDKAERSYADDASARGNLQLLLAQAEMQHLSERRGQRLWQNRSITWPLMAGVCLLVIGGSWLMKPVSVPQDHVGINRSVTTEAIPGWTAGSAAGADNWLNRTGLVYSQPSEIKAGMPAAAATAALPDSSTSTAEAVPAAVEGSSANTAEVAVLSTSQIRQAVRDGGRSLRGK